MDAPIVLLLVFIGMQGPVVVVDDLATNQGRYATMEACTADVKVQQPLVEAQINGKPIVLADMICFDLHRMPWALPSEDKPDDPTTHEQE